MPRENRVLKHFLMIKLVLVLILLIFVARSPETEGKIITVDDDGPAEYTSIQEAVNETMDGDTVRVLGGTYHERVWVNTSIDLLGEGWEKTIIQGEKNKAVVTIHANLVNMSGFTVTGGIWRGSGIKVRGENITISRNNCSGNGHGIDIEHYSTNCTVENNICQGNTDRGIRLWHTRFCLVRNNTCRGNENEGIYIPASDNCTVEDNICEGNKIGIGSHMVINASIANNICLDNSEAGISLFFTIAILENNTLQNPHENIFVAFSALARAENNTLTGKGLYISAPSETWWWDFHSIGTSNTVNGKPIYYFSNDSDFKVPRDAGQIILGNFSNVTIKGETFSSDLTNILIGNSRNVTFDGNTFQGAYGELRIDSSINCYMINNAFKGRGGITLYFSEQCELRNNSFLNGAGIQLQNSDHCTIRDNVCENSWINLISSSRNTITGNTCQGSENGIYLQSSDDCTIEGNICENNKNGINLSFSDRASITNNICRDNEHGIHLRLADHCRIENNSCSPNKGNDIHLERSTDIFTWNNAGKVKIITGEEKDEEDDGGFLPSFGTTVQIPAFVLAVLLVSRRQNKRGGFKRKPGKNR